MQLDLANAEIKSLKLSLEAKEEAEKERISDSAAQIGDENGAGGKEAHEITSLLISQQQDHQKELDKRDALIHNLQQLFQEVEGKQATREV